MRLFATARDFEPTAETRERFATLIALSEDAVPAERMALGDICHALALPALTARKLLVDADVQELIRARLQGMREQPEQFQEWLSMVLRQLARRVILGEDLTRDQRMFFQRFGTRVLLTAPARGRNDAIGRRYPTINVHKHLHVDEPTLADLVARGQISDEGIAQLRALSQGAVDDGPPTA